MKQNKLNNFYYAPANIYYILTYIFIINCFTSCGPKLDPEQKSINKFMSKFSRDIEKKHNLYTFGTGITRINSVHAICMDFQSNQLYSVEAARIQMVEVASKMLQEMNINKDLIEHLPTYPFTLKNINTGILCIDESLKTSSQLACVMLVNGNLSYLHYTATGALTTFYEETFEEALEIIGRACNS